MKPVRCVHGDINRVYQSITHRKTRDRILAACTAALGLFFGMPLHAQTDDFEAAFDQALPTEANLHRLYRSIASGRANLDTYFDYARMARKLGKLEEAAKAYRAMLRIKPDLARIKLDLATLYLQQEKWEESRELLKEVSASNPPKQVREKIDTLMKKIEAQLKEHYFRGSFGAGMYYDTNVNSAPSTGFVTVLDTSLQLSSDATEKEDTQYFSSLTLEHTYRPRKSEDWMQVQWTNSATAYLSEQSEETSLNTRVYNIRTNPELQFESGLAVGLAGSYTQVELDDQAYLRNPRGEFYVNVPLGGNVLLGYTGVYEYRGFENAETVTTYEDRRGYAWQHTLLWKYAPSNRLLLDASLTYRREAAALSYHASRQAIGSTGITCMWKHGLFGAGRVGYKYSEYDSQDLLISTTIREDDEYSGSVTLGKQFNRKAPVQLVWTMGYQYREVDSNIQNYQYDNHRVSSALHANF